jgi:restriction system protein
MALLNSLSGGKSRGPSTSRRRQEGIFDMLATLPWWMSVVVAGIAYVFFKWVFPGLAGQSVFVKAMAQAFQGNAGLISCIFLIPAPIAFFNASRRRKLFDAQTGIESIRAMSWQDFELLVGEAFRRQGYVVDEYGGSAPDGGVDLVLHKGAKTTVVQCKRWRERQIGAPLVRDLFGAMHAAGAHAAIFVSSGTYTADAVAFARAQPIRLVDGDELASMVATIQEQQRIESRLTKALPPSSQRPVFGKVCPVCGGAMTKRIAKKGPKAGGSFWGCSSFPTCRGTLPG